MHRMSTPRLPRRCVLAAPLAAAGGLRAQSAAPIGVFAAASLQDALRAIEPLWRGQAAHPPLRFSFAASSALARQIEQGAPADLFASADEAWMDHLQTRGLILADARRSLVGNSLVLVGPADRPPTEELRLRPGGTDLGALLGGRGRIAVGDPAHVPAGRYARAALAWLGQWDALEPRLARADNVRAALLLVERGEAPLGIVYATDALALPRLRVLATFPEESHPAITYPFAVTRRAAQPDGARALLGFLAGAEAAAVWRRFGFHPAP